MIQKHQEFGKNLWFAGGAWCWSGFAPQNNLSLYTMLPAMQSVREHGIKNVIITMWGDNGKECSFYSLLPSLFTIRKYADGEFDEQKIKEEFNKLFGLNYDDFFLLDTVNTLPVKREKPYNDQASKLYLYADCFMNSYDKSFENPSSIDYANIAKQISNASERAGDFAYIFTQLASLVKVLEIKYEICKKTREAYESKNRDALTALLDDYDELEKRIANFHEEFYTLWHKENKPFGWEIQDARLGGVIQRVKTCRRRLKDYLNGVIDNIEELEEELLTILKEHLCCNFYHKAISTSSI